MTDRTGAGPLRLIALVGTLVVAGAIIRLLKERVEALISRLAAAARTDPLTQLLNRRAFTLLFDWELERARRSGQPVSVLIGDLDGFKAVNDRFGHQAGDIALQRASAVLQRAKRRADTLARIGGEEFALILPDSDERGAFVVGERVRCALRDDFASEPVPLTISFGVASFPATAEDVGALLLAADEALYAAKSLGRDRTVIHSREVAGLGVERPAAAASLEQPKSRASTSSMGADLAVLLRDDAHHEVAELLEQEEAVTIAFQPVVALATGRVVGYEALARFPLLPERDPAVWFDQAHRCGLGAELEAAGIRAALERTDRPDEAFVSLNVSPSTLASAPVVSALPDDLTGIVLELTERELISEEGPPLLSELRGRGALIAVDDAGSAYAGLQQVMRLQPDIIKLDRPLVEGVHARADKAALVDAFVAFAHRTGATVCAEGIEQLADLSALADLDVDYGQGFVLGRPAFRFEDAPATVARTLMRRSLESSEDGSGGFDMLATGDRRLERLCAEVASVRTTDDLDAVSDLLAAELHADAVVCSLWDRDAAAVRSLTTRSWSPPGEHIALREFPLAARVLAEQVPLQVLRSDPTADPEALARLDRGGYRSLLMVPITLHGECLGLLAACSRGERPWTRTSIHRARILCHQLGPVVAHLSGEREHLGDRPASVRGRS